MSHSRLFADTSLDWVLSLETQRLCPTWLCSLLCLWVASVGSQAPATSLLKVVACFACLSISSRGAAPYRFPVTPKSKGQSCDVSFLCRFNDRVTSPLDHTLCELVCMPNAHALAWHTPGAEEQMNKRTSESMLRPSQDRSHIQCILWRRTLQISKCPFSCPERPAGLALTESPSPGWGGQI